MRDWADEIANTIKTEMFMKMLSTCQSTGKPMEIRNINFTPWENLWKVTIAAALRAADAQGYERAGNEVIAEIERIAADPELMRGKLPIFFAKLEEARRRAKADGLREAAEKLGPCTSIRHTFMDGMAHEATEAEMHLVNSVLVGRQASIRALAAKLSLPHTPQEPT